MRSLARQHMPAYQAVVAAPCWAWIGGALSVIATTAFVIIRIVLDQLKWISFQQHTASPRRLLGAVLLVGGVLLITRF